MALINRIKQVLEEAQISKACHQQKIQVLKQLYIKVTPEKFFEELKNILALVFSKNTNMYVEKVLDFLASFIAEVTPADDDDDDDIDTEPFDDSIHPFLTMVIKETLRYHHLVNERLRYNSCLFVRLILLHLGNQKNLDNEVCDLIQNAMLERTSDPKSSVRLQAVMALLRLQDPYNPDCPVINAYLSLIVDPNPQVRSEVVKSVHISNVAAHQIINRLQDVDHIVRMAAYRRLADFSPKSFRIVERHHILNCGLTESNQKVKTVFTDNLLPKWLNIYGNNYIEFLRVLKLDADEDDMNNTENLTRDLVNLLVNIVPIKEITSNLPLTEDKVIKVDQLTSEAAATWNLLVHFLRENDSYEDLLEEILPDLTPFCEYLERVVQEKSKKDKMEEWEFLEYQYILNNLFGIAENYDMADEVGRNTLHQLSLKLLREEHPGMKLKKKIVGIASQTSQKADDFTSTICHIISDIQEHFVEKRREVDPTDKLNKEWQAAEIRVKIITLGSEMEDAVENDDFLKANSLKMEIQQLKEMLQEMNTEKPLVEMVKVTKTDPKTISECLDLLICLLKLPNITSMSPSLVSVKDEFVIPQLSTPNTDIHWRALECLALFSLLQQSLAEEYLKTLIIPILTYRSVPNYNKNALMNSVNAVSDLFRLYGSAVFTFLEETMCGSNQSMNSTTNKRRLYNSEDSDENNLTNRFCFETIIEVILDMLDDELPEIRNTSIRALTNMIFNKLPVSPHLITRLILKWYNPLTAKCSDTLQQLIGVVIGNYANCVEGAKEVIAKAIIPIFQSISSAPKTSPLADVDVDSLILFLSTITQSESNRDSGTHLNMVHSFTYEILKTKNSTIVLFLSKMLVHLDISTSNVTLLKELIAKVDGAFENENVMDRFSKRNLCKFKEKLNAVLEKQNDSMNTVLELSDVSTLNTTKTKSVTNGTLRNLSTIAEEENNLMENNNSNRVQTRKSNDKDQSENVIEKESSADVITTSEKENTTPIKTSKKKRRKNRKGKNGSQTDSTADEDERRLRKRRKSVNQEEINSEKSQTANTGTVVVQKSPKELQVKLKPLNHDIRGVINDKNDRDINTVNDSSSDRTNDSSAVIEKSAAEKGAKETLKRKKKRRNRKNKKAVNSVEVTTTTGDEEEQPNSKRLRPTDEDDEIPDETQTSNSSVEVQQTSKELQVTLQNNKHTNKVNTSINERDGTTDSEEITNIKNKGKQQGLNIIEEIGGRFRNNLPSIEETSESSSSQIAEKNEKRRSDPRLNPPIIQISDSASSSGSKKIGGKSDRLRNNQPRIEETSESSSSQIAEKNEKRRSDPRLNPPIIQISDSASSSGSKKIGGKSDRLRNNQPRIEETSESSSSQIAEKNEKRRSDPRLNPPIIQISDSTSSSGSKKIGGKSDRLRNNQPRIEETSESSSSQNTEKNEMRRSNSRLNPMDEIISDSASSSGSKKIGGKRDTLRNNQRFIEETSESSSSQNAEKKEMRRSISRLNRPMDEIISDSASSRGSKNIEGKRGRLRNNQQRVEETSESSSSQNTEKNEIRRSKPRLNPLMDEIISDSAGRSGSKKIGGKRGGLRNNQQRVEETSESSCSQTVEKNEMRRSNPRLNPPIIEISDSASSTGSKKIGGKRARPKNNQHRTEKTSESSSSQNTENNEMRRSNPRLNNPLMDEIISDSASSSGSKKIGGKKSRPKNNQPRTKEPSYSSSSQNIETASSSDSNKNQGESGTLRRNQRKSKEEISSLNSSSGQKTAETGKYVFDGLVGKETATRSSSRRNGNKDTSTVLSTPTLRDKNRVTNSDSISSKISVKPGKQPSIRSQLGEQEKPPKYQPSPDSNSKLNKMALRKSKTIAQKRREQRLQRQLSKTSSDEFATSRRSLTKNRGLWTRNNFEKETRINNSFSSGGRNLRNAKKKV